MLYQIGNVPLVGLDEMLARRWTVTPILRFRGLMGAGKLEHLLMGSRNSHCWPDGLVQPVTQDLLEAQWGGERVRLWAVCFGLRLQDQSLLWQQRGRIGGMGVTSARNRGSEC